MGEDEKTLIEPFWRKWANKYVNL